MAMDSDCSAISLYREVRAMSDYIRREDARHKIKVLCAFHKAGLRKDEVKKAIESCPSVDVVEVIRCCNCQYWNSKNCGCNCPEIDVRDLDYMYGDMRTESNHFCGYGKRRTIHDGNNQ